jgi:ABC-type antimicrobial peptide transport system permease subunit
VPQTDPNQSYFDVQVMTERIASGIWQQRASGMLFGLFAALALALAAIGLFGVLTYVVSQQTREIGIRVALGAVPTHVVALVVGRGLALTAGGAVVGLAAAWIGTRFLSTVLFDVQASDPLTLAGVPMVLLAVALAACYAPARRAARVDPVTALRAE